MTPKRPDLRLTRLRKTLSSGALCAACCAAAAPFALPQSPQTRAQTVPATRQDAPVPAGGTLIDSMDTPTFAAPKEKGRVEAVEGKFGGALKFSFEDGCQSVMATGRAGGTSAWDKADGFSFWVKGDGSAHLGGLEFIWNGDYAIRYAYAFPIDSTEWKKVVVRWSDLIPETSGIALAVDAHGGNAPSKLGAVWFGKWWYWKDYAAHSYAIDDLRLEPMIAPHTRDFRPLHNPLARVLAKLKAGQPVRIVTMGDSLTDPAHWTNREHNWPALLQTALKQKYGAQAAILNPALGGTELRQNLVLLPRWTPARPAPDLVTILFGFNDWNAGMRGPAFERAQQDAIDRVRRATNGQADILILTPCPSLDNGTTFGPLALACRNAAQTKNAGLCDTYQAFQAVPAAERASLYVEDKVHLSLRGQQMVAQAVLNALAGAARP